MFHFQVDCEWLISANGLEIKKDKQIDDCHSRRNKGVGLEGLPVTGDAGFLNDLVGFLDVFSGTGTISFTEKTQPEYLFRTLLPQCVSIMARLP